MKRNETKRKGAEKVQETTLKPDDKTQQKEIIFV